MPYTVRIPALEKLLDFNQPGHRDVQYAALSGASTFVRAYLYRLDLDRANPLGGDRTHFYRNAADSLTQEVDDNGATININEVGFRQRLLGGEIHAKNAKYLTIPAIAEAYGHRATEFDNLHFIMFKSGSKALAGKSGEDRRVWYWLVESVTQDSDPTVLPEPDAIAQAAISSVKDWLNEKVLNVESQAVYG